MQKYQYFTPLVLACLISACSDKPVQAAPAAIPEKAAPAAIPEASMHELLKAVFGAQYRADTKDALTKLPTIRDRKKLRFYRVKPIASTLLKSGEMVLLAQSDYAEQNPERDVDVIEDETLLSVYLLRQSAGKWTVHKRHENTMYRGENSGPGSVLFPMLNKDKQVLALANYLANDGCPARTLYLIDLSQDPLGRLTEGIPLSETSNENCGAAEGAPEKMSDSTWYLAPPRKASALYDDVVVTTVTTTYKGVGEEQTPTPIAKGQKITTRYAFDGKKYKLVGGKGPSGSQQ
jgi:hypothetical protein